MWFNNNKFQEKARELYPCMRKKNSDHFLVQSTDYHNVTKVYSHTVTGIFLSALL